MTEQLKTQHPIGLKGIFNKSTTAALLCSVGFRLSLLIAAILTILSCCNENIDMHYGILKHIVDIVLSILPDFLGFCIGGYALVIGVSSIDVMRKMSKPLSNRAGMSYFQVLSSTFGASLVIQCFTLFLSYIINIITEMELIAISHFCGTMINVSIIFLISFLSLFSIFELYYVVVNIFTFGQMMHFSVRYDDIENESQKTDNNVE